MLPFLAFKSQLTPRFRVKKKGLLAKLGSHQLAVTCLMAWNVKESISGIDLIQQQQHKLYLHDYNYVVTVLQKLKHKKQTNKSSGADPHRFPPFYGNRSHFSYKIYFKNKNTFQVETWPISHLNYSETQERGLWGVKIQIIFWGSQPLDSAKSLRLQRSFRKSVSIYPRSAPDHNNDNAMQWLL